MTTIERLAVLEAAVRSIIEAVNEYLPPDATMTKDALIDRVIEAVDNATVVDALQEQDTASDG